MQSEKLKPRIGEERLGDMKDILILLVAFQLKHFLADYPLQTKYMLGKFKGGPEWIKPLVAHCCIHAFGTLIISLFWLNLNEAFHLVIIDFSIHFVMDRIKAAPDILGRFKPEQPQFWWSLGFDQMVHHLTHYLLIFLILCGG